MVARKVLQKLAKEHGTPLFVIDHKELRKQYEELAATLLGGPVSIRCIIAPKPGKTAAKSSLVQHAVKNPGVKIVSDG